MGLIKFKWKTFLVYVDDVILYSNSFGHHLGPVDEILTTIAKVGVTLKMKKCTLFIDKVQYIVHVIRAAKREVSNAYTAYLRQQKPPTKCELCYFLRMCNTSQGLITDLTGIYLRLDTLLRKWAPEKFKLDEDQPKYFSTLTDKVFRLRSALYTNPSYHIM